MYDGIADLSMSSVNQSFEVGVLFSYQSTWIRAGLIDQTEVFWVKLTGPESLVPLIQKIEVTIWAPAAGVAFQCEM